ncbi:hypothetical protein KUD11_07845 [Roseovarius sp. LXJ103]|uniref:hypothetical protein n=1 Tax=Roseovarius carneus TaxID=2853164 RepID=UPI000D620187|nr:hypothetical protein [Roseovarius carneus]MBZ8118562.1 hypothetical protein [Roseovarius carneus]PWE35747.1 hypothetical protein DD563_07130 [Pelagicola sp. LXJ1103]
MRLAIIALLACTAPAHAWEFTPGAPCLLTSPPGDVAMALTYDPTTPRYTVSITAPEPWPQSPLFVMRFDGPSARQIGTNRHTLSDDGRTLTVTDSGFGNVLDGMAEAGQVVALTGDVAVALSLSNVKAPLAAFRACEADIPVS